MRIARLSAQPVLGNPLRADGAEIAILPFRTKQREQRQADRRNQPEPPDDP